MVRVVRRWPLGLELGEVVVEPVVAGVDQLLVRGEPALERRQRRRLEPVQAVAAGGAHADEADLGQHLEVLGHLRLGEVEPLDQLADRRLAVDQRVEDVATVRFGDGVEDIGRRGGAGHARHIYSDIGICQADVRRCRGGGADATNASSCTARVIATYSRRAPRVRAVEDLVRVDDDHAVELQPLDRLGPEQRHVVVAEFVHVVDRDQPDLGQRLGDRLVQRRRGDDAGQAVTVLDAR